MLTTFAYYPSWQKKFSGTRAGCYRTDHVREVPVYRCWHYVPRRVSAPAAHHSRGQLCADFLPARVDAAAL